jgi:hypothetical protein
VHALNLKALNYEQVPIHPSAAAASNLLPPTRPSIHRRSYRHLKTTGDPDSSRWLSCEYLEERYPAAFTAADPADRALVRSMALIIACEIHPIQNLRVLVHLKNNLKQSDDDLNLLGAALD